MAGVTTGRDARRRTGKAARPARTVAVLALVAALVGIPADAAAGSGSARCTTHILTVDLGTLWGRLCRPAGPLPTTVQLLVHGQTFNHAYWDFPYQPAKYSFSQAMNRAGYATFVIDRLGMGGSTVPPSSQLSLTVEAAKVHQVVQQLRSGAVGGVAYLKVLLAGHSMGAAVTNLEAATYHDVDALLVTSLGHHVNWAGVGAIADAAHSPNDDPVLRGRHDYDDGYATTRPGTRASVYYANRPIDAGVLAADEATKDVNVVSQSYDPLSSDPAVSRAITAPVLFVIGDHDPLFCAPGYEDCASAATVAAQEGPDWPAARSFDVYVLPDTGHGPNLAPNTQLYQHAVCAWADRVVGTH